MAVVHEPRLADKVAFLSDAASYPQATASVQAVETHMSWVFLTERHAWKLKKPERVDGVDLASVEARRRHCALEMRLNRRFTDDVYLEAVPLRLAPAGALSWDNGLVVDWLVKMRRLPEALMLDRLIAAGTVRAGEAARIGRFLGRFYLTCAPEPIDAAAWRARLAARIRGNERELRGYAHAVDNALPAELGERQLGFLTLEEGLLQERIEAGRVVEGHGDLRPEHVCLEEPVPRVIDCLEFDRHLRIVDAAEELGYLALECERLGAPELRDQLFDAYEDAAQDSPDHRLVHFYQSVHACSRAWLALRHLRDPAPRDAARWPALARDYLRLASEHVALCAAPKL